MRKLSHKPDLHNETNYIILWLKIISFNNLDAHSGYGILEEYERT